MFKYKPPGDLDDLHQRPSREAFLEFWHKWIENNIRNEIAALQGGGRGDYAVPSPLFFSEADTPAQSGALPVTWNAYPLAVDRQTEQNPTEGWRYLDTLRSTTEHSTTSAEVTTRFRPQDEYCEWHWYDGERPRIAFTAEGPEYWIALASQDMDRVVELYRELVSPEVRLEELLLPQPIVFGEWELPAGFYNPFNVWNTKKGVVHLTHGANTLGAEINLAARATILRRDAAGRRITESRRLIASSGYGSVNRSSDPNIGYGVNITAVPEGATKPLSITLANPVGLYMDEVAANRITDDQDRPLSGWFKFVRGKKGYGLHAEFSPPPGDTRALADVLVDGEPLQSGAQIARLIQMVVYAATADLGAPMSPLHPPVFRACVPAGTDLSNLAKVNLSAGWNPDRTCMVQGADESPPINQADAYPELFALPAAGGAAPTRRRNFSSTRNA